MKCIIRLAVVIILSMAIEIFPQSSGTGFLISNNGYITTCYHVIEDATEITVRGINSDFDKKYNAKIIASDKSNDLAILKVECELESSIKYSMKWDISDVGQEVFTLGYPLKTTMGEEIKLTNGIISSKSGFQGDVTTYQMTVPVQPGNSGGPLFDKNGYVIGVVSAKHAGAENAGYAIKTNILRNIIQSISQDIPLPSSNQLIGKPLTIQVNYARKDVLIIESNIPISKTLENFEPINLKTISIAKLKDIPDVTGRVLTYIPQHVSVMIVGKDNSYWKIFYQGKLGYSHERYFEKTYETFIINEVANLSGMPAEYKNNYEKATITYPAKMRDEPFVGGDILETISKGSIIYVVGFQDSYWKIYYNGQEGFLIDGLYFSSTNEMMRFKE
jgi:V8-like Glu-specific endopeptidase